MIGDPKNIWNPQMFKWSQNRQKLTIERRKPWTQSSGTKQTDTHHPEAETRWGWRRSSCCRSRVGHRPPADFGSFLTKPLALLTLQTAASEHLRGKHNRKAATHFCDAQNQQSVFFLFLQHMHAAIQGCLSFHDVENCSPTKHSTLGPCYMQTLGDLVLMHICRIFWFFDNCI